MESPSALYSKVRQTMPGRPALDPLRYPWHQSDVVESASGADGGYAYDPKS